MRLEGDKKLIAKFQSLEKKDAKAAARKGTRAGTKIVTAEAKVLSPVDTGTLKNAIKTRSAGRLKDGAVGTITTIAMKGKTKSNWYYGAFQEYGWTTVNGRKIAGKHFMKEAADQKGPQALDAALNVIRTEIEKK